MYKAILVPLVAMLVKPSTVSIHNNNYETRPAGESITAIVIHDTEDNDLKRCLGLFASRRFHKGPHYVISKSGKVYQMVPDQYKAWHAGISRLGKQENVNDFSIGIELINRGNGHDAFTDAQYKSLAGLVAYLMHKYNIPLSRVVGHKDVAIPHGRKVDPARNFKFDRLRVLIKSYLKYKVYRKVTDLVA